MICLFFTVSTHTSEILIYLHHVSGHQNILLKYVLDLYHYFPYNFHCQISIILNVLSYIDSDD